MTKATIEKLKKNPHYKLSAKQRAEAREPMKEFGQIPLHSNEMKKHPTEPNIVARHGKNVL